MAPRTWTTRAVSKADWEAWRRLFTGYCDFYERPVSDRQLRKVWSWIHDDGSVKAIVAVAAGDATGEAVGLAHLRPWVRPLRGEIAGYLDDLFVEPAMRGTGAVEALFAAIGRLAKEEGWGIVRWTTAEDNHRAQAAYDRVAERTGWITYEMTTGSGPPSRGVPLSGGD
jgi:RimJ/RimL family protein N-acetyltransferase